MTMMGPGVHDIRVICSSCYNMLHLIFDLWDTNWLKAERQEIKLCVLEATQLSLSLDQCTSKTCGRQEDVVFQNCMPSFSKLSFTSDKEAAA